ncbi:MAG TPA: DUF4258 domain-containing protein [Candidatus Hydrogenedentes bacterium]|nr:DUF4258 domain-containing protein [Candidatus Hydrogenedentota bacterium]
MGSVFDRIVRLVQDLNVKVSDHGYDEMVQDSILVRDIIAHVSEGVVVEEYPRYPKGPCVLVLQKGERGEPIHVVWGIPRNTSAPAVVGTAYRPDADRWSRDFTRRKE